MSSNGAHGLNQSPSICYSIGEFLEGPWQGTCQLGEWIISPIDGCDGVIIALTVRPISALVLPFIALVGLLLLPFAALFKWVGQSGSVEVDARQTPHYTVPIGVVTGSCNGGGSGYGGPGPSLAPTPVSWSDGYAYESAQFHYTPAFVPPPSYAPAQVKFDIASPYTAPPPQNNNNVGYYAPLTGSKTPTSQPAFKPTVQAPPKDAPSSKSHSDRKVYFRGEIGAKSDGLKKGDVYAKFGTEDQRYNAPFYIANNKVTSEDEKPLYDNPKGCFILFKIYPSEESTLHIPSEMYLPEYLFRGKVDGQKIRLRYEGKLIEFTINQPIIFQLLNVVPLVETFEEVLANIHSAFAKNRKELEPRWISYRSSEYRAYQERKHPYQLGKNGAVYKYSEGDGQFKRIDNNEFCPKDRPVEIPHRLYVSDDPNQLHIVLQFFADLEDFDIVINGKYLNFYVRSPSPVWTGMEDLPDAVLKSKNVVGTSGEGIYSFEWPTYFQGLTLGEMKEKLEQMTITKIGGGGMYRFSIPMALKNQR